MNIVNAINNALEIKLAEDENVVIYGEDVGREGGVFRVTENLQQKYGDIRVFDSPLAESAIAGTAVGMAVGGLRPIIEMQFDGFVFPAFNQILSHIARYRNRTRGKYNMPIVIRIPNGGGINALEHHSESIEAFFAHIPGIKVVMPSTPYDAKGLMISSIESEDPIIFLEPKRLYRAIKQEVPEEKYKIPIGKAKTIQEGTDVTVVTYGAMVREVQKASIYAKQNGISVEIIDLRTIYPIDKDLIRKSIQKTGKIITVAESPRSFSVASEIGQIAVEEAFMYLEAPPKRISGFDTIVPLPKGEHFYMITPEIIYKGILETVKF